MRLVLAAAARRANREGYLGASGCGRRGARVVVVAALMIRFDTLLLKDLARTPDDRLQLLTRKGWMVAIGAAFPLGPLVYMTYGKRPSRYR
jgi:hypothetical protein